MVRHASLFSQLVALFSRQRFYELVYRQEKGDAVRLLIYQAESSGLCDSPATGNGVAYRRDRYPQFLG